MTRCPSCGIRLEYDHDSCPQCLRSLSPPIRESFVPADVSASHPALPPSDEESLQTIARFANAAEAGFFAHALLSTEEIPAFIRVEENFDAVSGYWSSRYLLDVPEGIADSAARSLQSLIDRSEREDILESKVPGGEGWEGAPLATASFDNDVEERYPVSGGGFRWGPIVITLAAGSLAFFGMRALQPGDKPGNGAAAGGRQKELWDQLSRPGRPWTQKLDDNRRRELRFNKSRTRATIREYKGDVQTSKEEFALPGEAK